MLQGRACEPRRQMRGRLLLREPLQQMCRLLPLQHNLLLQGRAERPLLHEPLHQMRATQLLRGNLLLPGREAMRRRECRGSKAAANDFQWIC